MDGCPLPGAQGRQRQRLRLGSLVRRSHPIDPAGDAAAADRRSGLLHRCHGRPAVGAAGRAAAADYDQPVEAAAADRPESARRPGPGPRANQQELRHLLFKQLHCTHNSNATMDEMRVEYGLHERQALRPLPERQRRQAQGLLGFLFFHARLHELPPFSDPSISSGPRWKLDPAAGPNERRDALILLAKPEK